jgi:hypothetical protein
LTENPVVIDDEEDGDPTDRSNHTLYQTTVNDPGVGGENTDGDADAAAHTVEGVANSDLDDTAIPQDDDRSAIAISTSFSPEIPESDSEATLEEERQLHPSVQGDSIVSLPGKRSRSLSRSDRANGRGSDWVFDVFAEDDSGTQGDGSPPSKRARSSPPPLKAQVPGSTHDDRLPRCDQEYEVHQIFGESELEYGVTAVTKIWLPKASVGPKLVRKYRAQQRAATQIRTRWSSRLQSKN